MKNLFACLVHENRPCVIDLVRNLHHLDPASGILLYNGGTDPDLLRDFPLERYGAVLHPNPRPMQWGALHGFALDCMRFGLQHYPFDIFTIIDSDQLGVRPGYTRYVERFLNEHPEVGMLGKEAMRQGPATRVPPAHTAQQEVELWRPFLRRFPRGEEKYVHWTFWPSTVFTADAARDLTHLFDTDAQLQEILRRSRIWATEEVILPTLVALLGYRIAASPCSYDFVQYRTQYTVRRLREALVRPDVYWVHPVPRRVEDRLRRFVRGTFNHYPPTAMRASPSSAAPQLLLTRPILKRMQTIDGWLEEGEADLLIGAVVKAAQDRVEPLTIVEVGSYCGRSTVVLGQAAQALRPGSRVYAIDPHEGVVGAADAELKTMKPTLARFRDNVARAGLTGAVETIQRCSFEVTWNRPIHLLLIDGLHDYANVARDFSHFASFVAPGGLIAFHDYADYYPGVQRLVDEVLAGDDYCRVGGECSMIVIQKSAEATCERIPPDVQAPHVQQQPVTEPLVSCIMPTAGRRAFVPQALQYFLVQDYPARELIVVDDGADPVNDLIPEDPRVRYVHLPERLTIGAKRNAACEMARGSCIIHWDDDDWNAPWRLRYQVEHLLESDADLCGLHNPLFYSPQLDKAWQYVYPEGGKPWVYGATLCYRKSFWSRWRFPEIDVGEDTRFVWQSPSAQILALSDPTFFVALVHSGNSSPKRTTGGRWQTYAVNAMHDLMGDSLTCYTARTSL